MNIYVGNLAWKAKKQDLTELFQHFGEVTRAFIVRDKRTRRSKGFGFVEMEEEEAARAAIEALNNTVFLERAIVVNEAHPRKDDDDEDTDEFDEE
ncbi:MAG: RNA-binding protein [Bacteroidetes bacterium]|nr:RNA-binding protein [Bacteroidota bacterium]MCH8523327.1 RNA-binding protein [Balneolales bacterium]